ncbi:MAG TPA: type IV secretion system protein [Coxiellaceae bacterium]|nr:type IV secretion system protein [Coxiellaceae bacterium]
MKKPFIHLLVILLLIPFTNSYSMNIGGIVNWLQKTYGINVDIKKLDEEIQRTQQGTLLELQNDLRGNFGYGNLFNSSHDLITRQWSGDSWLDALNQVSNSKTSAFVQAQQVYAKLYPLVNAAEIGTSLKDGSSKRNYYQQSTQINRTALAASSYSFNQTSQHVQRIHDILAQLEKQPSEKAAIDLTARLMGEVGFLQVEALKQQNIQNQITATESQNNVNGMSDQARFMQWNPTH